MENGALDSSYYTQAAEIYVAVALNRAESQVLRGENANRRLAHTAIVKKLAKVFPAPVSDTSHDRSQQNRFSSLQFGSPSVKWERRLRAF